MEDHDAQLQHLPAVLGAVAGVSDVSESKYTGPDLNRMNVFLRVQPPDGSGVRPVRANCSQQCPTKLGAARDCLRKLELIVGESASRAAEQQVADAAAGSTSALAATDPPAAAPRMVGAVLGATQRLQAELHGAELRANSELQLLRRADEAHDAARLQVLEARAALDQHTKRQRTELAQVARAHRTPRLARPISPPTAPRAPRPTPRAHCAPRPALPTAQPTASPTAPPTAPRAPRPAPRAPRLAPTAPTAPTAPAEPAGRVSLDLFV